MEVGSELVSKVIRADRAAEPAWMKGADDPVANLNSGHALADATTSPEPSESVTTPSFVGPRPPPFEDHQIAVIERTRPHPHQDFLRPGLGSSLDRRTISSTLPKRSMW